MTDSLDTRPRSALLVWFVPLVALLVSGWLLHREYRDRGPEIEIEFANGAGIEAGRTPLMHNGVVVGTVKDITLKPDLNGALVRVALIASAAPLAVEGSEFWLVRPEIGVTGVQGLETIFSGVRLHARAGQGRPETRFRAREKAPVTADGSPGRTYVLRTERLGGLVPGTAVYFREVKVGTVAEHRLAADGTHVLVTIMIFEPYHRLVRPQSRFWNSGGISMKIGLTGAEVRSNSLESLLAGGISFATPDDAAAGEPPPDGTIFELFAESEKAWLKWEPKIPLEPAAK